VLILKGDSDGGDEWPLEDRGKRVARKIWEGWYTHPGCLRKSGRERTYATGECVRVANKGLRKRLFCVFAHDGRRSETGLPQRHRGHRAGLIDSRDHHPPEFLYPS
jgi:hypothetical protein